MLANCGGHHPPIEIIKRHRGPHCTFKVKFEEKVPSTSRRSTYKTDVESYIDSEYVYDQFTLYVNINKLYALLYDVTPRVPETDKGFVDILFISSSSVNTQFITSMNIKLNQLQPSLKNLYYTKLVRRV